MAFRRGSRTRQEHVRRREHRHDGPWHWALLSRQSRPLARHCDLATFIARLSAGRSSTSSRPRTESSKFSTRPANSSRLLRRTSSANTRRTPSGFARTFAIRPICCSRRRRAASGFCSKAPRGPARRRPRHVSRSSRAATAPASASRAARACRPLYQSRHRRRESVFHARRRRTLPDRAGQRDWASTCAIAATNTAPSPVARAVAAGSTPSPFATPAGSAASMRSP